MRRRKSSGSKKSWRASTTCICARWPISTTIVGESSASARAAARSGKREIMPPLLEVLDGFDRALNHMGDAPSSVSQGLQALHRKLLGVLEAQGVTPLQSVGETFNPELHEAIGSVESEEVESGAVAEEVQRGYRWGDEVLRPARVRESAR